MEAESFKVLIVVKGGTVQSIYSSNSNLKYDILDFDNEELDDENEEKLLINRSIGLEAIY
jgi:hypothetical protein